MTQRGEPEGAGRQHAPPGNRPPSLANDNQQQLPLATTEQLPGRPCIRFSSPPTPTSCCSKNASTSASPDEGVCPLARTCCGPHKLEVRGKALVEPQLPPKVRCHQVAKPLQGGIPGGGAGGRRATNAASAPRSAAAGAAARAAAAAGAAWQQLGQQRQQAQRGSGS